MLLSVTLIVIAWTSMALSFIGFIICPLVIGAQPARITYSTFISRFLQTICICALGFRVIGWI